VIGGDHCLGAVGSHLFVAAVVKQDYVAAVNLFCYLALDRGGWRGVPVVAGYVPHDWLEAEFAGQAEDRWAASSEGRAEKVRGLRDGVLQGVAALGELPADLDFALEDQEGMSEGVIADDVAGLDNLADDLRMLLHVAPDQEKSRVYIVFRQDFEQAQGVRIVGTVVVG